MVIDILIYNKDTVKTIPVKSFTLPKSKSKLDTVKMPMEISPITANFVLEDFNVNGLKEWGQYYNDKIQESVDEEGCGAVMCEFNLFLWQISDAFYENHARY